jgi:hydroxypyruvate isomerase
MMANLDFTLAASAEMLFLELPLLERVEKIHSLGFAVEIWDWREKDLPALAATGAHFTSMTGYISGRLADGEGAAELLRTAELSIQASRVLGKPSLNIHGTGLDSKGLPVQPCFEVTSKMWEQAEITLHEIADLAEKNQVTYILENLNLLVDHPGTPFGLAKDVIKLVKAVNKPSLRMNFDIYHAQIGEGNLIALLEEALPIIGEIQVADVPGRKEPGTGEINYPNIAKALRSMGYSGVIGLEGWASRESEFALERFRNAFA